MGTWNYREDSTKMKLTPEFKSKYIVRLKNKEFILSDGLKALAHEKGIKELSTEIIQLPTTENGNNCIWMAKLIGYDYNPITEKIVEVTYTSVGDASPTNCQVKDAFIRMAETRAIARVLRNYTNIGMVAFDELSNGASSEIVESITVEQLHELKAVMSQKGITKEQIKALCKEITKSDKTAKDLTLAEADKLIKKIKSMKDAEETTA